MIGRSYRPVHPCGVVMLRQKLDESYFMGYNENYVFAYRDETVSTL